MRRRFPDLPIDTCASGGRRNDLETLRRALPLWRSDHAYEPVSMQALSYGLAMWVPYHGTGVNSVEPYIFRSQMTPAVGIGLDPATYPDGYKRWKRLSEQWRQVSTYYFGDYYPLTPYSLDKTEWMAWQFDVPEKGEGMVQAFRRPESPFESARFRLRGLDAAATYTVKDLDAAGDARFSGRELMEKGMPVLVVERPGAVIVTYKKR